MYIPKDTHYMTNKYSGEHKGICGQACLAVITKNSIRDVLQEWKDMGLEFKGWSGWKQLQEYLKKKGFNVIRRSKSTSYNKDYYYIARVQLIGDSNINKHPPFYGWGHWSLASANTHFIVIYNNTFYCNEDGIFPIKELKDYLKHYNACITSYLEIHANSIKKKTKKVIENGI